MTESKKRLVRLTKSRGMTFVYVPFSEKEPCDYWLFCGKRRATWRATKGGHFTLGQAPRRESRTTGPADRVSRKPISCF